MADTYSNTLASRINIEKYPMQAGIIKKIIETSPLINMFPTEAVGSRIYMAKNLEKLPATQTRSAGAGYSSENIGRTSPKMVGMAIFGNKFSTDRVDEGLPSHLGGTNIRDQIMWWAEAWAQDWKKYMIAGSKSSSTGKEYDGLKEIVTSAQSLSWTTLTGDTDIQTATVKEIAGGLDAAIDLMITLPKVIIMNRTVRSLMRNAIVDANNETAANLFRDEIVELPGVTASTPIRVKTMTFRGIPVICPDEDSQGTAINGFTEGSGGTGSGAYTSIWFVSDYYKFMMQYAEGMRVYTRQGEVGPVVDIDFPMVMDLQHQRGIARIYGIEAS